MYTEFIIIYIGMGIMIVLQIAVMIMLIVLLIKAGKMQRKGNRILSASSNREEKTSAIVYCSNCATGFSGTEKVCPKCGMIRQ